MFDACPIILGNALTLPEPYDDALFAPAAKTDHASALGPQPLASLRYGVNRPAARVVGDSAVATNSFLDP
ncbi:MAG: hypothetical protein AB7I09_20860 [Planctomycetota bacterium]